MFEKLLDILGVKSNPMYEGLTSDEKKQLKNPNSKGALESKLANRFFKSKDYDRAFYFANIGVEKGHNDSFYILYICLRDGLGIEKDEAMSIDVCKKGAAKDDRCSYELGKRYKEGRGVKQDLTQALRYLHVGKKRPKDINDMICQIYIAQGRTGDDSIYLYRDLALDGCKSALEKLIEYSNQNNLTAKWYLYHIYASDPKSKFANPPSAAQLLYDIEALGDIVNVAKVYEKGDKTFSPDVNKAIQLYLDAAKGGDLFAASRISRLYFCHKDLISQEIFLEYAKSAANQGYTVAQESLALHYFNISQEFNPNGEGYKWAYEAAKHNSGIGLLLVGMCSGDIGYGSEAKMWFTRAKKRLQELSEAGDGDAYYFLSQIYSHGLDADSPVDAASHPTYKQNTITCLKNAIILEAALKEMAQDALFNLTGETL